MFTCKIGSLILLSLTAFCVETRLVDSGRVPASEICIFEMTGRVGGRVYSLRGLGPDNDLTVDIGGYRTVSVESLCQV